MGFSFNSVRTFSSAENHYFKSRSKVHESKGTVSEARLVAWTPTCHAGSLPHLGLWHHLVFHGAQLK